MNTGLLVQSQNVIVVPTGLIGYWSFNDGSGSYPPIARDFSGNNNTAFLFGSSPSAHDDPKWTTGIVGNALSFDGANSYIMVPDKSIFSPGTGDFSIVVWIKTTFNNSVHFADIIRKYGSDPANTYAVSIGQDNKMSMLYRNTGNNAINLGDSVSTDPGSVVNDGKWHHIAWVRSNGSTGSYYLDSLFVTSATNASTTNVSTFGGNNLQIGRYADATNDPTATHYYFNGSIDEVRLYNRALKQSEITSLYQSTSGGGQIHPSVLDWGRRVVANGGVAPSTNTLSALTTFYRGLDSSGLLPKMKSVNCFVPDNLTAARTPLIKTYGNDPWTNTNFVSGDLTVNGLKGDGSGKRLDTGVIANTAFSSNNSAGITFYSTDVANRTELDSSVLNNYATSRFGLAIWQTTVIFYCWSDTPDNDTAYATALTNALGFYSANRTSGTYSAIYAAHSTSPFALIGDKTTAGLTSTRTTSPLGLYSTFDVAGGNIYSWYSSKRFSFMSIHDGLTSGESQTLYNLVQAMRTSLGGGFI